MSDIFLSYTSEDRDCLRPLVKVLEDQGWSVFWDRKIPVGQTWREVIGREITDCLSIVVVWSQASVKSQWVMEEAEEGKRRRTLFPVTVDGTTPPFGFGSIQSADFTDWEGGTDHPGYKLLIGVLTRHIQGIKDQQEGERLAKEQLLKEQTEQQEEEEKERKANAERERQAKQQAEQSIKEQEEAATQQLADKARKRESEAEPLINADKKDDEATGSELKTAESVIRKWVHFRLVLIGLATLAVAVITTLVLTGIYFDAKPILKNIQLTGAMLPEMVSIPPGSFTMGCVSRRNCEKDELPTRQVTVPAFDMGKYEVTFRQWDTCHADGGCTHNPSDNGMGRGDRPVIKVSWNDTQQYVGWLSRRTGENYRLPSEAEWEYAARAGTKTSYWWGNEIDQDGAVWANCRSCGSEWDGMRTVPVGSFKPNRFGLYDTSGNVYEWVRDCSHRDNYDGAPSDGSAWVVDCSSQSNRVMRGGSWIATPLNLRSATRKQGRPNHRNSNFGFRLARTP